MIGLPATRKLAGTTQTNPSMQGGDAVRLSIVSLAMMGAVAAMAFLSGCGGDAQDAASPTAAVGGPEQTADSTAYLAPTGEQSSTGQPNTDHLHPVVVLETSAGSIKLELDAEKAPQTVDNFLHYVDNGHYDQTIFHQVTQEAPKLIIGGAYTSDLTEKETRAPIYNEAHRGLKNDRGTIAMARQPDAEDSATCHFFLNATDNQILDHQDRTAEGYGYCAFGKVIEGMDVVDKIGAVEVRDTDQFSGIPVKTVMIESARRVR